MKKVVFGLILGIIGLPMSVLSAPKAVPVHGVAMHGSVKYKKDFKHFEYLNPDAPKGGELRLSAFGSFDTFNPHVIKGIPASGISMMYDTLMVESQDEPFSEYGLVAQSIEIPKDRSWVAFNLREQAKFHDGQPITADDVIFSFDTLRTKGLPLYRHYFGNISTVTATSPRRVLFQFKEGENAELPLILGQMPVLPKHYWQDKDFTATTLTRPVGSGAYKIKSFETGRYIVFERDPAYWAQDLPIMKGMNNFDTIRYDYYRDATVALEAFKSGEFDLRIENEAKKWFASYDIPAVTNGSLIKKEFKHGYPSGMQGFVFNTRNDLFKDVDVRKALTLPFDFEWSNKTLFYSLYKRTQSYFDNSDLKASGLPKGEELKLLDQYRNDLPGDVFQAPFRLPVTDGSGNNRTNLLRATDLLKKAGWSVQDGILKNKDGTAFTFEILLDSTSSSAWERITLPYVKNLKRLGIIATIRTVDPTQYKNRTNTFDFDMIVNIWGQSMSPGNEQRYFWGSSAATMNGSQNFAGINNAAIDALIEKLIEAPDRKALVARTKALDRALLWSYYVIPHWYAPVHRLVFWNKFGMPDIETIKGANILSWWLDPEKQETLKTEKQKISEAKKAEQKNIYQRLKEWF